MSDPMLYGGNMIKPSNPLLPTGPHVTVWVVSVQPNGAYQPLAVFATEAEALDLCNRIAISAPEQKPRRDSVWIPDKSVYAKAEELANNRNAGIMLRSADELDPNAPVDEEWAKTHHRDVTADIAAGRPTAIGRMFGAQAVQIVGGVRPPRTEDPCGRYSFTQDYRLLDSAPMKQGKPPLVFDVVSGDWVDFAGTEEEQANSIPVSMLEAVNFCAAGTIPAEVRRIIEEKFHAPDNREGAT